jgi:alpha-D-ribose 1-methylphosphonate 5-triphosphate synthase subunit PhnH
VVRSQGSEVRGEHPALSSAELREHGTFEALMWALSRPGQGREFGVRDGDATGLETVAEALLDLEVSFFSSDVTLQAALARTGAQARAMAEADYIFCTHLEPDVLRELQHASIGTLVYPDQSATIVIACAFDSGLNLNLTGPGIQAVTRVRALGVSEEFFALRNRVSSYPLGWDVLLIEKNAKSNARVIGLPRTTRIELI